MESWFKSLLNELACGRNVQIISKGNSMRPLWNEGDTKLITPILDHILVPKDVVLVRVKSGKFLTHQILDIQDDKYIISNIAGKIDDIVTRDSIYGLVLNSTDNFEGLTFRE